MLKKSPSGALSPYYYKGGYFHGIHYGSYFDDREALFDMMKKEEYFLLSAPERRRILMDFYETNLTPDIVEEIVRHIGRLKSQIVKLAVAADRKNLRLIGRAIKKSGLLADGQVYYGTDMEEGKTWLVSDSI